MGRPLLLIHGYSSEGATKPGHVFTRDEVAKIYGGLADRLAKSGTAIETIDVSRYISLDDDLDVDDISFALQRALQNSALVNKEKGGFREFDVIIHSTGALVIRNWIRRFTQPESCPIRHIIHLAGANFGSGWAHIGDSELVKFGREIFGGTERGLRVLSALEFASDWTIDLHRHFLQPTQRMFEDYGVQEFCIVGSQVPAAWVAIPIRYAKEDGADGVVRVSTSNLNWNYVKIVPAKLPSSIAWNEADEFARLALEDGLLDPLDDGETKHPFDFDERGFAGGYYTVVESHTPARWKGMSSEDVDAGRNQSVIAPRLHPHFGRLTSNNVQTHLQTPIPFAIPYQCAHSSQDVGVVSERIKGLVPDKAGNFSDDEVVRLIKIALGSDSRDSYLAADAAFDEVTRHTYARAAQTDHIGFFGTLGRGITKLVQKPAEFLRGVLENPKGQYEGHCHIVFRVKDQNGQPVRNFSVYLDSFGNDTEPNTILDRMFQDTHKNDRTSNTISFYLRVERYQEDEGKKIDKLAEEDLGKVSEAVLGEIWKYQIPEVNGIDLEIDIADIDRERLCYVPLRMRIKPHELVKYLQPHRTTVFDIELMRLPTQDAYQIPAFQSEEPGT